MDQHDEVLENNFYLLPNYPNPFNPTTSISYMLEKSCDVNIEIYNTLGVKIKTLVQKPQPAGKNTITWNGTDNWGKQVASGIYFVYFQASTYKQTQKMILMR
jgi:flagellar hook assembly protein FlgD